MPEQPPDLETLARAVGELQEEVVKQKALTESLRERLDKLAPPIAKRPPKAQGLRQNLVVPDPD